MITLNNFLKESVFDPGFTDKAATDIKNTPFLKWANKYKGADFQQGSDFNLEYDEKGKPVVAISGSRVYLQDSTCLDMIKIKWPKQIISLHLLYDDYLTKAWVQDNFKDIKSIESLNIHFNMMNIPELNLDIINTVDTKIGSLNIMGDGGRTKIIVPKILNCQKLQITNSKNIFYPRSGMPCEEINLRCR